MASHYGLSSDDSAFLIFMVFGCSFLMVSSNFINTMPFKYLQEYELEDCFILNFLNFFSGATVILDLFIQTLSAFLTSL